VVNYLYTFLFKPNHKGKVGRCLPATDNWRVFQKVQRC